jgi:DNA-damage-inducible protein J
MSLQTNISISVDNSIFGIGLTTQQAINVFFRQVLLNQGLPFNVSIPKKEMNQTTINAMEEKNLATFNSVDELYDDLGI